MNVLARRYYIAPWTLSQIILLVLCSFLPSAQAAERDHAKPLAGTTSILILVDKSSSMSEAQLRDDTNLSLEIVKESLREFVPEIAQDIRVGLIAFDSVPFTLASIRPLRDGNDDDQRHKIFDRLSRIFPAGQTNLEKGLQEALRVLSGDPSKRKHILLVTDGKLEIESDISPRIQEASEKGISVSSFLVDRKGNRRLLAQLSGSTGGDLYLSFNKLSLRGALRRDLADIATTKRRTKDEVAQFMTDHQAYLSLKQQKKDQDRNNPEGKHRIWRALYDTGGPFKKATLKKDTVLQDDLMACAIWEVHKAEPAPRLLSASRRRQAAERQAMEFIQQHLLRAQLKRSSRPTANLKAGDQVLVIESAPLGDVIDCLVVRTEQGQFGFLLPSDVTEEKAP